MKKVLWMLVAAALAITACQKPQYIIPIDDDEEEENPGGEEAGFKEKTWRISFEWDELAGYGMDVATLPGEEIADFFGLTQQEFYKGMGTWKGSTGDMTTSQENNTIMFGIAEKNNTDNLKWIPASTNSIGHWYAADGSITTWGNKENLAVFYMESVEANEDYQFSWGQDAPSAQILEDQWKFTVGVYPDRAEVGKTYKATVVYFYTNEDEVECYAYVEYSVSIKAAEAVDLNIVKTQEITHTHEFIPGWGATSIQEDIDFDAVAAAIGISADEATVYAINSDGSVYPGAGTNFWFSVAGDVISYGAGCGIDINKDAGYWTYCNYPDETLAGQTLKGAIAFVNPANNNAYVVKVTVNLETIDYTVIDVLVSYEAGMTEYTLNENNLAALAAALGVESVSAEDIGTTYPLKGINADGSIYDGDFTANNGYWYTLDGNVTNWAAIEAAGYVGAFIEYHGDYIFGCGMWEESGKQSTVKLGIGDAILTFNLTVAEPAVFNTEEAGVMDVSASQAVSAGYGGGQIVLDAGEVAALIGEGEYTLLNLEGMPEYTANGGFWFGPDGLPSEWKDGVFYFEPADEPLTFNTGIHPDNVTEPSTLKASCRLANLETMKHITLNITVTAE